MSCKRAKRVSQLVKLDWHAKRAKRPLDGLLKFVQGVAAYLQASSSLYGATILFTPSDSGIIEGPGFELVCFACMGVRGAKRRCQAGLATVQGRGKAGRGPWHVNEWLLGWTWFGVYLNVGRLTSGFWMLRVKDL